MGRDDIHRTPRPDAARLRRAVPVDTLPAAPRWGLRAVPSGTGVTPGRGAASSLHAVSTLPRHAAASAPTVHDPSASAAAVIAPPDHPVADWDEWLGAWKARLLQSAAGLGPATAGTGAEGDGADRIRADIQAFVAALDGGHTTLLQALHRSRHLEVEVTEARAALATALVDLAGTRAGERHARHLALHDGLTALPNRRYFREKLAAALAHRRQERPAIAVLYLDLDGFKPINDTHGHDIGDKLLQIVAARLARTVRAGDMVSRLGGDEFACLIEGVVDRAQLGLLADKLFEAVAAPLVIGTLELVVRPSIGIAVCPSDGHTAERLLESADAAMYRAKRTGAGHAFVHGDTSH